MPRRSSVAPELNALLVQAKATARQHKAELAPIRKQRTELRKRHERVTHSVRHWIEKLEVFDSAESPYGQWFLHQRAKERAEVVKELDAARARKATAALNLAIFDQLHPELTNGGS